MSAEAVPGLIGELPGWVQIAANFGVVVIVAVGGAITYIKKIRGSEESKELIISSNSSQSAVTSEKVAVEFVMLHEQNKMIAEANELLTDIRELIQRELSRQETAREIERTHPPTHPPRRRVSDKPTA